MEAGTTEVVQSSDDGIKIVVSSKDGEGMLDSESILEGAPAGLWWSVDHIWRNNILDPCYSKWDPWTSSVLFTCELRCTIPWPYPDMLDQNLHFNKTPRSLLCKI